MLFSDESIYSNLGFRHTAAEEAAADTKAIELLKNSPYGQKLDSAGLFLKALQASAPHLPALLTAHLGNNMSEKGTVTRMSALINSAPALEVNKLDQIAALTSRWPGEDERMGRPRGVDQVTAGCTHLGPGQAAVRSDAILPAPEPYR